MHHHVRRSRTWIAALAATLSLIFVGCSSSHTTASSSTTAPAHQSFTVNTPEGAVSVSLDGELPPQWPSDFPIPPDTSPAGSGSIGGSTASHMIAVFQSSGTGQDAFNFYKNSTALTVSGAKSVGTGNSFLGRLRFSWTTHSGSVTVTEFNGHTYIVVYLETSASNGTPTS